MSEQYKALRNHTLDQDISYCRPPAGLFSAQVDDPATKVMTNFREVKVVTTQLGTSINDCNEHMIVNRVRLLLVTDDKKKVQGILTAADILGEKPMQHMQKNGVSRDEVQAMDIMTPINALETLKLHDVETAKVGDIVETLIKNGRQHAIVTCEDNESGDSLICGMFSATQIGKQIGIPIEPSDIAKTFAELEKIIAA